MLTRKKNKANKREVGDPSSIRRIVSPFPPNEGAGPSTGGTRSWKKTRIKEGKKRVSVRIRLRTAERGSDTHALTRGSISRLSLPTTSPPTTKDSPPAPDEKPSPRGSSLPRSRFLPIQSPGRKRLEGRTPSDSSRGSCELEKTRSGFVEMY